MEFLDQGELDAALIETNSALNKKPALVKARILVGDIHPQLDDGVSAEKEFSKAAQTRGRFNRNKTAVVSLAAPARPLR